MSKRCKDLLPAKRNSDWSALNWGFFESPTPIEPPLVRGWTLDAPGRIDGVSSARGALLVAWAGSGWDIIDPASGTVRISVAKGPKRETSTRAQILPGGEFVWIYHAQSKTFLWNPFTDKRSPFSDCYFSGFLGDALVIRNQQHALTKVIDGKSQGFQATGPGILPMTYCRDPYWYRVEYGDGFRIVSAMDPISNEVTWSRRFDSRFVNVVLFDRTVGAMYEGGQSGCCVIEAIDAANGETFWKRDFPEAVDGDRFSVGMGALYARRFLVLGRNVRGGTRAEIIDMEKDESAWYLQPDSTVKFVTGTVVWLSERPVGGVESSYSTEFDLVARRLETGEELWRREGLSQFMVHEGRLYSWRGKKLTCWIPGQSAGASEGANVESGAGASPKRRGSVSEPADEATWRELVYYCDGKAAHQALPLGVLLEGLRKCFSGVKLFPTGVIEVYDGSDLFWGRLEISKRVGRGKSFTGATLVLGWDLEADELVIECLNGLLQKAGLAWEIID